MSNPSPKVDGFIRKSAAWQAELQALREIVLACPLVEEVKWRVPCYTTGGKNILFLGRFKGYCLISFIKGVLLKDPEGVLTELGKNTQSARVIRFTDVGQIVRLKPVLTSYVHEAIEIEKSGKKVAFKKTSDFDLPEEFRSTFDAKPALKAAFDRLTPGRQRAYLLYFAGAKQSKTRQSRVDKCVPRIMDGKGLDD